MSPQSGEKSTPTQTTARIASAADLGAEPGPDEEIADDHHPADHRRPGEGRDHAERGDADVGHLEAVRNDVVAEDQAEDEGGAALVDIE